MAVVKPAAYALTPHKGMFARISDCFLEVKHEAFYVKINGGVKFFINGQNLLENSIIKFMCLLTLETLKNSLDLSH